MSDNRPDHYTEMDEVWEHIRDQDDMIAKLFDIIEELQNKIIE